MREDRPAGEPRHFATLWEAIADEIPSAPALTHGARTIAWGEFEQRAARLAGALLAHGLGPGSVVACYLYNCPEYFEIFLAALKIRAVPRIHLRLAPHADLGRAGGYARGPVI